MADDIKKSITGIAIFNGRTTCVVSFICSSLFFGSICWMRSFFSRHFHFPRGQVSVSQWSFILEHLHSMHRPNPAYAVLSHLSQAWHVSILSFKTSSVTKGNPALTQRTDDSEKFASNSLHISFSELMSSAQSTIPLNILPMASESLERLRLKTSDSLPSWAASSNQVLSCSGSSTARD